MRKFCFVATLALAALLLCAESSLAGSIVSLQEAGLASGTNGSFYFPSLGKVSSSVGTLNLIVNWDNNTSTTFQGFCVEDVYASSDPLSYQLLTPGAMGDAYVKAAWLFDNYLNNTNQDSVAAAATQIAIWEV